MFLRGCARRKIIVAALLSERYQEAVSVELEEVQLRLTHLFERFSVPILSMTSELRWKLGARELSQDHFSEDGSIYKTDPLVRRSLAQAVADHSRAIEMARRAPRQRNKAVYEGAKGVVRVTFPTHASAVSGAATTRERIGPLEVELLSIQPGGSVEYNVEGELLGLAVVVGPKEGLMRLSIDSEGFDDLRATPVSLWSEIPAPVIAQVNVPHLLGRRAHIAFPTRVVIHNVSHDPGLSTIRADYGASPPMELELEAPIRVLALIERRPTQNAPPATDKADAEAAAK